MTTVQQCSKKNSKKQSGTRIDERRLHTSIVNEVPDMRTSMVCPGELPFITHYSLLITYVSL